MPATAHSLLRKPNLRNPSTAKVEMPSDPAALLELAAKKNGLQNVTAAPWHIKATYQVLDDKGSVKETGTFEEILGFGQKYKLELMPAPASIRLDYSTEEGLISRGRYRDRPEDPLACDGALQSVS